MDSISETALTRCCLNQLKPYKMEKLMSIWAIALGGTLGFGLVTMIVEIIIEGVPHLYI
jgi:hypothetical protein